MAYKTNTQGPLYPGFKAALDHLIGLHFIEEKYKGAYPAFEARKAESDANEFFRIRNDGKGF
ncbi:MAG TPA: hypothetical protein VFR24_16865 [Candidatus Angelobacter sp.]|nr:hypothetical protein [Candidatus Angelobacter sp.]